MVTYNNGKTPGTTQYVQAVQQVTNGEASVSLGGGGGGWVGAGSLMLDKDNSTYCSNTNRAYFTIYLKYPILINRIVINAAISSGGMTLSQLNVTQTNGKVKALVETGGVEVYSYGFDTGNFAPMMAKQIDIHLISDTLTGEEIDIFEVAIFKLIQVMTSVDEESPLLTVSEGQVVLQDIDRDNSSFTSGVAPINGSGHIPDVFDALLCKINSNGVNIAGGSGENVTFKLNHPMLINRVSIAGSALDAISIDVIDINGVTTTVATLVSPSSYGLDSGDFTPINAVTIIVKQDLASGGSSLNQVMIQKILPAGVVQIDNLPVTTELYGADGTSAQVINLDKRGKRLVQALSVSSDATKLHIFTLSFSFDNTNWYVHYISKAPEQFISKTIESAARYWELDTDAVVGAHKIDLILGAVDG